MNRIMTLRRLQFLHYLKITFLTFVGIVIVAGGLTLLTALVSGAPEIWVAIKVNNHNVLQHSMELLSNFIGLWIFIVAAADGYSDFDTAMRLGNSRRHYFLANVMIYAFLSLIYSVCDTLSRGDVDWQSFLGQFSSSFIECFIMALVFFAFYKWSWKVIVAFFGVQLLLGTFLVVVSSFFKESIQSVIRTLMSLPPVAHHLLGGVIAILVLVTYYLVVQKLEVK